MGTRLDRRQAWALGAVGAGLSLVATLVTVGGSTSEHAWLEGLARGAMVSVPIAAGVYAWRSPPFERFGRWLTLAGLGAFAATLAESRDPFVYSTARVVGWVLAVWIIYLVLAFPSGSLRGRIDRALVTAGTLLVLGLYLLPVLVAEGYPAPSPWTSCHGDCPENAFMLVGSEPALIDDVVRPLRELMTIALFAAVAVRVGQRIREGSRITWRAHAAVLVVACVWSIGYAVAILGSRRWPEAGVVEASAWLMALGVPALAGAFFVGVVRWRLFIARATQRLATSMRAHPGPEDVRAALADAFEDPSLEIIYWLGDEYGGWADAAGQPIQVPAAGSGRCLTQVKDAGRPVAAILHDCALRNDHAFIDSAASYAVMSLDNHRLSAEAASLLREVGKSRARIQKSADDERRRIERDLHDGGQQRLVALRVKLAMAAEKLDGGAGADLLTRLGSEVDVAIDEIRTLARGIYPSPLADWGLVEALRSAALEAALPTSVLAAGVRSRYPREIESAAYFGCLEALQNALKHARGATAVVIEVSDEGGRVRVEVRHDGDGFDPGASSAGVGFARMRDRFAAVGGEVAIMSSSGRGTRVIGTIPFEGAVDGRPEGLRTRTEPFSASWLASRIARR